MNDLVIVADDGPVRTVRMNRPDKKNALTLPMYETMSAAIESAGKSDTVRCVLIAGTPAEFTAGNDIGEFLKMASGGVGLAAPLLRFLRALARSEVPMVAAVQGNAVGIGTTLLMHCDFAVAASNARFSTPFVGLGLVPEAGSSLIAPRLMGHARAFSLLVMGRAMNADEAKAAGLVNTVVAPEAVEAEAMKAARELAALPPQAVLASRRLLRGAPDEIVARIDEEAELFGRRLQSAEARAAFETFLARKK
jgi:enoyl-CoA hydratase/carnithine racemase